MTIVYSLPHPAPMQADVSGPGVVAGEVDTKVFNTWLWLKDMTTWCQLVRVL